jgi:hypothetical protein
MKMILVDCGDAFAETSIEFATASSVVHTDNVDRRGVFRVGTSKIDE